MRTSHRDQQYGSSPRVSRRLRVLVYGLAALLALAGTASVYASAADMAPTPAVAATATGPIPAPVAGTALGDATCFGSPGPSGGETVFGEYYSCDPDIAPQLAKVDPDNSAPPIMCDLARSNGCFWRYAEDPSGLLPAWRWRDNVGLYTNMTGLDGVPPTLFSFLASVFFSVSQLAWWLLLEVSQWVLTDTLVQDAGNAMNAGYVMLTDLVNASGLLLFAAAIALFIIVKLLARGRVVKIFGVIIAFAIPVGLMQGLAMRVDSAPTSQTTAPSWVAGSLPTGSPAWFAVSGVNLVDGFTSWFTSGFGRLATLSGSMQVQQANAVDPSCSSYVSALYDQYYSYSSTPIRGIRQEVHAELQRQLSTFTSSDEAVRMRQTNPRLYSAVYGQVSRNLLFEIQRNTQPPDPAAWGALLASRSNAEKLIDARHYKVATVSQLWQRAFAGTWTAAQFGNQVWGAKMYCHLLEWNADISPEEQHRIADVANKYSYVTGFDGAPVKSPGYADVSRAVFEPGNGKEEMEQHLFAFAACRRIQVEDGSWKWSAEPAWAALGNGHGIDDEQCETYFMQNPDTMERIQNVLATGTESGVAVLLDPACDFEGGWFSDAFDQLKRGVSLGSCHLVDAANNFTEGLADKGLTFANYFNTEHMAESIADNAADAVEADDIDRNGLIKPLQFKSTDAVNKAIEGAVVAAVGDVGQAACAADPAACAAKGAEGFADAKEAGRMVLAFKGTNASQRLTLSLLALVTSFIYVYAIGFLALGSFLAKFGLVLMIILLPATLMALAWPGVTGERGSKIGKKMLRLTGGFVLSHGLLAFVLGLLLSVILLFESFIGGDGGGFIHALIPLVALFIVRQMLKAAGLGDLLSAQGALGMPLSASLAAGGKDLQTKGMGKFNSLTGGQKYDPKTGQLRDKGLSRFDALAKRTGKNALMLTPRAAGKVGKKAWGLASDRYAVPERLAQLRGTPDKDGVLQNGLAQRMKSFAGLMALSGAALGKIPGAKTLGAKVAELPIAKKFSSTAMGFEWVSKKVHQDRTARAAMARRREEILAVSGKKKNERIAARAAYHKEEHQMRVAQHFARHNGEMVYDAAGRPIYGYQHSEQFRTADGAEVLDDQGRPVYAVANAGNGARLGRNAFGALPSMGQAVDAAGNPMVDAAGNPIYGWALDDPRGTTVLSKDEFDALSVEEQALARPVTDKRIAKRGVVFVHDETLGATYLNHEQFNALSADEQARAIPVTDPTRAFFTDEERIARSRMFHERHHLRAGQAVVSAFGDPIIAPVLGDANGNNRMVQAKNIQATMELAAHWRIQYLPNHEKMRPEGFNDDEYHAMLMMLNAYHNGYDDEGKVTDILPEVIGQSWESPAGQRELMLMLEGKDCALRNFELSTPPEVLASIRLAAKQYSSYDVEKQSYADMAQVRFEALTETQADLQATQERISSGTVQIEAQQVRMRTTAPKLKSVRNNLDELRANREQEASLDAERRDLEDAIAALERSYESHKNSGDPATKMLSITELDTLTEQRRRHEELRQTYETLTEKIRAAARQEAAWQAEERQLDEEMRQVVAEIGSVSRDVFEASKHAEELGAQLEFAFKSFRRDKGKENWSQVDDQIDSWIKAHNSKWAAEGRDLQAKEIALIAAAAAGEEVATRKSTEELTASLNRLCRAAARAAGDGASKNGHIMSELAKLDGNTRYIVETNPEVIPWTGKNYMGR